MELKDRARVQGQWGDEEARDQSAGGTLSSAIICLDLEASPVPPGGSACGQAPDRGYARTRRSHVHGLGAGKQVWVKFLAIEPEGPEDEEDFALGVQPRSSASV
jgi:hypothetical protein